mmetsp:Transcript_34569/g.72848  ORF Transcript_34569/g.72848 Transcript_34569/m.72848 type:complete len:92 (+) Transcript_34569:188-463(+)
MEVLMTMVGAGVMSSKEDEGYGIMSLSFVGVLEEGCKLGPPENDNVVMNDGLEDDLMDGVKNGLVVINVGTDDGLKDGAGDGFGDGRRNKF